MNTEATTTTPKMTEQQRIEKALKRHMPVEVRVKMMWIGIGVIICLFITMFMLPDEIIEGIESRAHKMIDTSTILFQFTVGFVFLGWVLPITFRMDLKTELVLARNDELITILNRTQERIEPIVKDAEKVSKNIEQMVEKDVRPVMDKVKKIVEKADENDIADKLKSAVKSIEKIADRLEPPKPPPGVDPDAPLEPLRALNSGAIKKT